MPYSCYAIVNLGNPLFVTPTSTVSAQNEQQMNAVIGLLGGHSRFGMSPSTSVANLPCQNAAVTANTFEDLYRQQFLTGQQQQAQTSIPFQSIGIKQVINLYF